MMSVEEATIWSAIIAASSGLLGIGLGALITYLTTRRQTEVAIQAIKSQSHQAEVERAASFALAALDKRLETHQKAYRLWSELYWNWNKPEVGDIAYKCQEFWYDHCLYLDSISRSSFKKILFHAGNFQSYDSEIKKKIFNQLENVGRNLTEGVDLNFMHSRLETTRIEDVQQGHSADVLSAAADP
jgi:hypothetical protein